MKSTVITHIHNEHFLLPLWLKHHVELFDDGVIIDYNSSDDPESIVREVAPHWTIRQSHLKDFNAISLDKLVVETERQIQGNRIALTVTEFLLGDPREADRQYFIPQILLINKNDDLVFNSNIPFHKQITTGVGSDTKLTPPWYARSMHQTLVEYGTDGSQTGRHYHKIDNGAYLIYRVSHCLVHEEMISRRLQIQHMIPQVDKNRQMGVQHHNWGKGLTVEDVLCEQDNLRKEAVDLSDIMNKYSI